MLKIKEKLERSLSKRRPENSFLRLFRSNTGFQPSIVGLDATDQEDFYADPQKETRNAMLEAERIKAMAIMAIQQQHQRFC
mgnify:CR=1 FL=1